jgi:hypothetical protein
VIVDEDVLARAGRITAIATVDNQDWIMGSLDIIAPAVVAAEESDNSRAKKRRKRKCAAN